MADDLVTVEDAAQYLGVHPETVRVWIRSGELRAAKIGRFWRVRRSEIERFVTDREGESVKSKAEGQ